MSFDASGEGWGALELIVGGKLCGMKIEIYGCDKCGGGREMYVVCIVGRRWIDRTVVVVVVGRGSLVRWNPGAARQRDASVVWGKARNQIRQLNCLPSCKGTNSLSHADNQPN